jgi:mono/diheme cytochrome c family protein
MSKAKSRAAAQVLLPTLAAVTIAWLAACSSSPRSQPADVPAEGERLYKISCSGCHGTNGHGNGPIAPILKVSVPDLTLIASRHGGAFPADEIYKIVDGQADLTAHGPRHMPVWGYEFFGDEPDDEAAHREASEKIELLVEFLRSIQRNQ